MFYIDSTLDNIMLAKEFHLEKMRCYINKKIGLPRCSNKDCAICTSNLRKVNFLPNEILNFFSNQTNVELLIAGMPEELITKNTEFWTSVFETYNQTEWIPYFDKNNLTNNDPHICEMTKNTFVYIKVIKQIINYEWFINVDNKYYNAYELSKVLGRNTCTYCNRVYTSTLITKKGKKIMRPTLDHWFQKSKNPLLAMSFHNLIPSCSSCNSSIKGTSELTLSQNTHPYVDTTQLSDFSFNYFYSGVLNEYNIFLKKGEYSSEKALKTLQILKMDEIYNTHQEELGDLIKIKTHYSEAYIDQIKNLFHDKLSYEEVYRILFGVEYESENFYKKPLSKFKHDILTNLGIKK